MPFFPCDPRLGPTGPQVVFNQLHLITTWEIILSANTGSLVSDILRYLTPRTQLTVVSYGPLNSLIVPRFPPHQSDICLPQRTLSTEARNATPNPASHNFLLPAFWCFLSEAHVCALLFGSKIEANF